MGLSLFIASSVQMWCFRVVFLFFSIQLTFAAWMQRPSFLCSCTTEAEMLILIDGKEAEEEVDSHQVAEVAKTLALFFGRLVAVLLVACT